MTEETSTTGIYAGEPSATSDGYTTLAPTTMDHPGPEVRKPQTPAGPVSHEDASSGPVTPTVSVKDFLDLTEKVYSLKDPAPFKLADDSDWKALVAEFKTLADKVTALAKADAEERLAVHNSFITDLGTRVTALEAPKAPVAAPSTPSPELSAFDARAKSIEDRLALFNSRSGQHI